MYVSNWTVIGVVVVVVVVVVMVVATFAMMAVMVPSLSVVDFFCLLAISRGGGYGNN